MWDNGQSTFNKYSKFTHGTKGKFLTDPVSDNKKVYCLIQKLHFLILISHQEITTACGNGWITITQYC